MLMNTVYTIMKHGCLRYYRFVLSIKINILAYINQMLYTSKKQPGYGVKNRVDPKGCVALIALCTNGESLHDGKHFKTSDHYIH